MKSMRETGWATGVAALIVACAVFVACKSLQVEIEIESFGYEGTIHGHFSKTGEDLEATIDQTANDARVDVEFRDADGNKLGGATGLAPGDSVAVPDGSAVMVISGPSTATSCTGCNGTPAPIAGGRSGGRALAPVRSTVDPTERFIYGFPCEPAIATSEPIWGPLANIHWNIWLRTSGPKTASQLFAEIAPIVMAAPGSAPAIPHRTRVNLLAKVVPNDSGAGARLHVSDKTAGFTRCDLVLNHVTIGTLSSNSVVYGAANGWQVVEIPIAADDFQFTANGSDNVFALTVMTQEDLHPNGFTGRAFYW